MGSWTPRGLRTAPALIATTRAPDDCSRGAPSVKALTRFRRRLRPWPRTWPHGAADGLSPASLRVDRAAIRYHHSEAGHANPADNEGVRRVVRGLTRRAADEGPHSEAGRRPGGQGAGGDPRDRPSAAHRTGRPNRGGTHKPAAARTRGRGAHLGHARHHAPVRRSEAAEIPSGRLGVPDCRTLRPGARCGSQCARAKLSGNGAVAGFTVRNDCSRPAAIGARTGLSPRYGAGPSALAGHCSRDSVCALLSSPGKEEG